jgi:hypothetical protein
LRTHFWNLCIMAFWAWLINKSPLLILLFPYNCGTKRFKCAVNDCEHLFWGVYFFFLNNLWLSFTPPVNWVVWRVRGWIVKSIMFAVH